MRIQIYTNKYKDPTKAFILSILEDEFKHLNVTRPDLDNISNFYQVEGGNFWLAINNGEIIGTIGLKNYQGKAYMKRMAVSKNYRGTGVAQDLLKVFIDHAQSNGFKEVYLSTSKNLVAANKFYEKEGFKRIESLPNEIPKQIAQINYMKLLRLIGSQLH